MTLHLRFSDAQVEQYPNVTRVLHAKFDRWVERVDVVLTLAPAGWVVARATATIAAGPEGSGQTTETSRFVFQEVRAVLEEAREPVAPA